MTVKELIEKLQELPAMYLDSEVLVYDPKREWYMSVDVEVRNMGIVLYDI